MSKLGSFVLNNVEWSVYEGFNDEQVILQIECPEECDNGLLVAPARFCRRCKGSGYLNQKVNLDPVGGKL